MGSLGRRQGRWSSYLDRIWRLFPFKCIPALSPIMGCLRENTTRQLPRMCKWTTKLVQKRQYHTLSQVLMIVGNNKDIKSILQPMPEEQATDHIQSFAPYDVANNITDTTTKLWTEILEKGRRILFGDIFHIDVESQRAVIPVTKLSAKIDDGRRS